MRRKKQIRIPIILALFLAFALVVGLAYINATVFGHTLLSNIITIFASWVIVIVVLSWR